MSDEDQSEFTRPPRNSRFKPGRSGNPKGRPKGTRNLKTDLDNLLRKRVQIREDGEQRYVSRQELMLLRLFERAAKGDARAATQILGMVMKLEPKEPHKEERTPLTESDHEIVADFLRRNTFPTNTES